MARNSKDSKERPNTYERIVETGLRLFNEEGERNISTNHIAQELRISPGNLYYHFRNKDEIILQLFKRYSTDLVHYIKNTTPPENIEEIGSYIMGVFSVLWDYRFLFSDVNTLIARNKDLAEDLRQFMTEHVSPLILQVFQTLVKEGILKGTEIELRDLATNLWLIAKYWFDFDSSQHNGEFTSGIQERGTYQILTLFRGFVAEEHREGFQKVLDAHRPKA